MAYRRPKIEVYETGSDDPKQRWTWRLKAANGRIVADSAEGYRRKADAINMATLICWGGFRDARVVEVPR